MDNIDEWETEIEGERDDGTDYELIEFNIEETKKNRGSGGSKPFMGTVDNGDIYWLKTMDNPQGPKILVVEQIVGKVGKLINVPVCDIATILISDELIGNEIEIESGRIIMPGIAHGSKDLGKVSLEKRNMSHPNDNRNKERMAQFVVFCSWCWGHDVQWLRVLNDENKYFSHDHGHYLPAKGRSNWDEQEFVNKLNDRNQLNCDESLVDRKTLRETLNLLSSVSDDDLINILKQIPNSWDVTDRELALVGWFLKHRIEIAIQNTTSRFGITL